MTAVHINFQFLSFSARLLLSTPTSFILLPPLLRMKSESMGKISHKVRIRVAKSCLFGLKQNRQHKSIVEASLISFFVCQKRSIVCALILFWCAILMFILQTLDWITLLFFFIFAFVCFRSVCHCHARSNETFMRQFRMMFASKSWSVWGFA